MPYANNKGADQSAHPHSLISAFLVHCLDSIIPLLVIAKIARLQLVSVAEQAGLSLTWSQTPKTGFLVTRFICEITRYCRYVIFNTMLPLYGISYYSRTPEYRTPLVPGISFGFLKRSVIETLEI